MRHQGEDIDRLHIKLITQEASSVARVIITERFILFPPTEHCSSIRFRCVNLLTDDYVSCQRAMDNVFCPIGRDPTIFVSHEQVD